jgi:hypothetical protein
MVERLPTTATDTLYEKKKKPTSSLADFFLLFFKQCGTDYCTENEQCFYYQNGMTCVDYREEIEQKKTFSVSFV